MGRKRKVVESIAVTKEDKASNVCSETTFTQEKLHLHTDNSNAMGATNAENSVLPNSNGIPLEKNSSLANVVVRRSERLKSSVSSAGSLGVRPVVEHVNLDENEKEEAVHSQKVSNLPVLREENEEREQQVEQVTPLPEVKGRSLEEKVDYLVRAVDEFKSKTVKQVFGRPNEDGPSPDINYKSLYINSQKKIEGLMEENFELVRKLEFARGKIAAYEMMKDVLSAPKEVILVPTLGKTTKATARVSPQAVRKCSLPHHPPVIMPDAAGGAADPKQKNNYKKKKAKH